MKAEHKDRKAIADVSSVKARAVKKPSEKENCLRVKKHQRFATLFQAGESLRSASSNAAELAGETGSMVDVEGKAIVSQ